MTRSRNVVLLVLLALLALLLVGAAMSGWGGVALVLVTTAVAGLGTAYAVYVAEVEETAARWEPEEERAERARRQHAVDPRGWHED